MENEEPERRGDDRGVKDNADIDNLFRRINRFSQVLRNCVVRSLTSSSLAVPSQVVLVHGPSGTDEWSEAARTSRFQRFALVLPIKSSRKKVYLSVCSNNVCLSEATTEVTILARTRNRVTWRQTGASQTASSGISSELRS